MLLTDSLIRLLQVLDRGVEKACCESRVLELQLQQQPSTHAWLGRSSHSACCIALVWVVSLLNRLPALPDSGHAQLSLSLTTQCHIELFGPGCHARTHPHLTVAVDAGTASTNAWCNRIFVGHSVGLARMQRTHTISTMQHISSSTIALV